MHDSTHEICTDTVRGIDRCRERLAQKIEVAPLTLGFDGFIDHTYEIIDTRSGPDEHSLMNEMSDLIERIESSIAMESSCTIEWKQNKVCAGGHTSHVGHALSTLGFDLTLIGTFGTPIDDVFTDRFDQDELVSVGEPTRTTAVEFDDGKIIFVAPETQISLNWETLCEQVNLETLAEHVDGARFLGTGCWAKIPGTPSIWDGLRTELWPTLSDPPENILIDTGDIRQLDSSQITTGVESILALENVVPVTVSANRAETISLANHLSERSNFDSLINATETVRKSGLQVSRVVSHAATKAVLATEDDVTTVTTSYTDSPSVLLSAGDHFNTGFVLATILGLQGSASLVLASAVAGFFVRNGQPPTHYQLYNFLDEYEDAIQ